MSSPLDTLLTRREAFKVGASLVSAYWFLPLLEPTNVHAQSKVTPRGSRALRHLRACSKAGNPTSTAGISRKSSGRRRTSIFVRSSRASSGRWACFRSCSKQRDRYSLIRSMEAWDSVHFRAQYYVQSAHMMNPALQKELPPMGSVVAYEYAAAAAGDRHPARVCRRQRHAITGGTPGLGLPARHLYAVSHRHHQRHRRHCARR